MGLLTDVAREGWPVRVDLLARPSFRRPRIRLAKAAALSHDAPATTTEVERHGRDDEA
jgi:hypothetical protein